jgi:hypothetical protein
MESPVLIGAHVPQELRDAVRLIAREHERSFSAEVRLALRQHVAHLNDEGPASPTGPLVNTPPMQAAGHES